MKIQTKQKNRSCKNEINETEKGNPKRKSTKVKTSSLKSSVKLTGQSNKKQRRDNFINKRNGIRDITTDPIGNLKG